MATLSGHSGMTTPLVSVILCVRNGMPYVRNAVDSIRRLRYRNLEILAQDGASTDGTTDYLRRITDLPRYSFVSAPDSGMGEGFNRALQRCSGDIITSVDADNRLLPESVATAVRLFAGDSHAAALYGCCNMVNAQGEFIHTWTPPAFDLIGLIDGGVVPPFGASFFKRSACGNSLYFDEDFASVPDFALWLRLADKKIVRVLDTFVEITAGRQSNTYQPESYAGHCDRKLRAIRRYLAEPTRDVLLEAFLRHAEAGLYMWAVDSIHVIDGDESLKNEFFTKAIRITRHPPRFAEVVHRSRPRVLDLDPPFGDQLLADGIGHMRRNEAEEALAYFELLERSGHVSPELPRLISEIRAGLPARRYVEMHDTLQAEVNRRDALLAELQEYSRAEIARRDDIILRLRRRLARSSRSPVE